MTRTPRTLLLSVTAALAIGILLAAPGPAAEAANSEPLPILTPADLTYDPVPQSAEELLTWAQHISYSNPNRYGPVWYDGQYVVLDIAGTPLASEQWPTGLHIRSVQHSSAELAQARETLTERLNRTPAQQDTDSWIIFVDPRSNHAVIGASSPTADLDVIGQDLPAAVTAWTNPNLRPLSRDNDTSPFRAGAALTGPQDPCTSGFAWAGLGTPHMLTAAHCAPSGGTLTVPSANWGTITSGSSENWTTGTGTVMLPNDTTYRGDLALAQTTAGSSTHGSTYRGNSTSNTTRAVGSTWTRSPQASDPYCTSGSVSGENCTWTVTATGANVTYSSGEVARNVTVGTSATFCLAGGDSGGPVYTVLPITGKARAKGIISSGSTGNENCTSAFTDVLHAVTYFGGTAQTS